MFGIGVMELLIVGLLVGVPAIAGIVVVIVLLVRHQKSQAPNPNLVPCPDCGNRVSLRATACPKCGRPL